ncbi:hypothetical protein ASU31_25765 [Pedobacter ginsenosidimutans]|uniref:Uncharacterized protein n=1 Tax=Pedobacter ginsenosidimutans TaxID=687842 RepID=A0A0T5VHB5_9SPHI|nr:hypothetical protein [Pedobacter ginsenosidimutans]KRT13211.1 hypothetical protein ASU31_25765 [Pedobacter ginsenosidimutans]
MENNQIEVKQLTIVQDPRLSLTQFSRYYGSTLNGRKRILINGKYPGDYIPKYYNIARDIITATFSANFDDYDLYFDEFRRHAARLKKEALVFPPKTDNYRNRYFSAGALEGLIRMSDKLIPILSNYVLNTNRKHASITVSGVKISAKADMLLFDLTGEQIGLLKFNFPQARLRAMEAGLALKVLKVYAKETSGLSFRSKDCLFIDIPSGSVLVSQDNPGIESAMTETCAEIKKIWPTL